MPEGGLSKINCYFSLMIGLLARLYTILTPRVSRIGSGCTKSMIGYCRLFIVNVIANNDGVSET